MPHRRLRPSQPEKPPIDRNDYLTSAQVAELTGLPEEHLVREAVALDGDGPPGFPGPDGAMWFNRVAVASWMARQR